MCELVRGGGVRGAEVGDTQGPLSNIEWSVESLHHFNIWREREREVCV